MSDIEPMASDDESTYNDDERKNKFDGSNFKMNDFLPNQSTEYFSTTYVSNTNQNTNITNDKPNSNQQNNNDQDFSNYELFDDTSLGLSESTRYRQKLTKLFIHSLWAIFYFFTVKVIQMATITTRLWTTMTLMIISYPKMKNCAWCTWEISSIRSKKISKKRTPSCKEFSIKSSTFLTRLNAKID